MRTILVVVLLFGVTLSGCFGGEADGDRPGGTDGDRAQATATPGPMLPDGLTMEGAEIVFYNDTEVVWRLEGVYTTGLGDGIGAVPIVFDVPGAIPWGLYAELAFEAGVLTLIDFAVQDSAGERRCFGDARTHTQREGTGYARCSNAFLPLEDGDQWSVDLKSDVVVKVPFTLTVHLFALAPSNPQGAAGFLLPQNLSMDPGEMVSYTETEAVWDWEDTVVQGPTSRDVAVAQISIPTKVPVHLEVTASWPSEAALVLEVIDGRGRTWCIDSLATGFLQSPALWDAHLSCQGLTGPPGAANTWQVMVFPDATFSGQQTEPGVDFTVRVRMTTDLYPLPTPTAVDDPEPGCDGQHPAVHHTAKGEPATQNMGTVVGCFYRTGVETYRSTIGLSHDGALHHFPKMVDADPDTGLAAEPTALARSTDGGLSWSEHPIQADGADARSQPALPYMIVDPLTDRIFVDEYSYNLAGTGIFSPPDATILSYSDDGGETWTSTVIEGTTNAWQSLAVGPSATSTLEQYPNAVYRCARWLPLTLPRVDHWGLGCHQSLDGGDTWTLQGYLTPPDNVQGTCDMTFGDAVVAPDGRLLIPLAWCATPSVAISEDEGRTWTHHEVSDLPIRLREETLRALTIDVDRDGTIYYAWLPEDGAVRVTYSKDGGQSWSDPLAIDVAGIETMRNAQLAVGAPGRVAIAYYGTDGGPRIVGVGNEHRIPEWHGYMTVTTDLFAAKPVFATARVNDTAKPLLVGDCDGRWCQEAADLNVVRIGPDGAPYANFVDGCSAAWTTCEPDDGDALAGEGIVAKLWGVNLWDDADPSGPYPDEATEGDAVGTWDFERYGAIPGVSMTQGVAYTVLKFDEPGAKPMVFE